MIRRAWLLAAILLAVPVQAQAQAQAQSASVPAAPAADRFILIEGGRNFRDLGGYRTADGHVVRRGVAYRSGSLGALTLKGQLALTGLNIRSIVDLRTTDERARDTSNWLAASGQGYWARDYAMGFGDMGGFVSRLSTLPPDEMRAMMVQGYRKTPYEQADSYREIFARLVAGRTPLVFNCTAGKDRTGVAAALVLSALGVPYETVREDFLLSNGAPGMDSLRSALSPQFASLPPESARVLGGVDGSYLDAAFDQIRKDHGSVEGYLKDVLGVGQPELARLRRNLLQAGGK